MRYQIRHQDFGVFQGEMIGMAFWHPGNQPELGIHAFETENCAQVYVDLLCSLGEPCFTPALLSVEPFDEELNDRLILEGARDRFVRGTL